MTEIETYIRARYPLLYVVTSEEERFLGDLARLAAVELRQRLWTWSITEGIRTVGDSGGSDSGEQDLCDPIAALEFVKRSQKEGIYLFYDFHDFLGDAAVRRLCRECVHRLKMSHKTMIICSPVFRVPEEMMSEVTLVNFPMPNREELRKVLDRAKTTLRQRRIKTDLTRSAAESLIEAARGLTVNDFENCLARSVVVNKELDAKTIETVLTEKKNVIRKTGFLDFTDASETIENIGGLGNLKEWLVERGTGFSQRAREFGISTPKGVLLIGVQGCGKSLTAKAVARLWQFPLLRLDTGKLFSNLVGSSEELARRVIHLSESLAPIVLWVDEIEKAFAGIASSSQSDAGVAARVFATLITWMQEKTAPVFVVATANSVTSLPAEVMRKGRFDEIFFIDLPSELERASIFRIHIEKRSRDPKEFDILRLAKITRGFSGAEIEEAVSSGLYAPFREGRPMATEDIVKRILETVPLSETQADLIDSLRAWARGRTRFASEQMLMDEAEEVA